MLGYKDNYLLTLLVNSSFTLNIADIQKILGVSKRSVYYSIQNINEFLSQNKLPELQNIRNKGLYVDPKIKEYFQKEITSNLSSVYIFTPQERVAMQVLIIACNEGLVNVSFLEEVFLVSRNTIINDLKEVRKELSVYDLSLEFDQKIGYFIDGLEIQKRSVLIHIISKYDYLVKMNVYPLYKLDTYQDVIEIMNELEKSLQIKYAKHSLETLALFTSILSEHHFPPIKLKKEDENEIKNSQEYLMVKKLFKDIINPTDYEYITMYIRGLRLHYIDEKIAVEDDYIMDIVRFIVNEFSKITLVYFEQDDPIFSNLYYHIKPMLNRLKYGIILQNKLKEQIFESYPYITRVTKTVCLKLEEKIRYPVNDDDVSYIAMHFGGSLKRKHHNLETISILLVCLNGVATNKLLRKEIEHLFNNVNIIDAIRLEDVSKWKDDVDYIVSTIPINNAHVPSHKIIYVDGILSEIDKQKLYLLFQTHNKEKHKIIVDNIFKAIKSYIPSNKYDEVRKVIEDSITAENIFNHNKKERDEKPMLHDIVTQNDILFKDKVKTWEDAIFLGGEPLLKQRKIEKRYLEKVIKNVHELGPYIGIAPNVAISHARPEDGVNELGISILILKNPIYLNNQENKPVRILITLASPDNEVHLTALQELSQILMEDLDSLLNANNEKQVIELIKKYSK